MSLQKLRLLPTLIRSGLRAPGGGAARAWEHYWGGISQTGSAGDVLWDGASAAELSFCHDTAERYLDRTLPLIDLGTGNGRYARALSASFPSLLGIDLAPSAVERARLESADYPNVSFRAADATLPDFGRALAGEIGPANVFIRGVFHVLDAPRQRALQSNIAQLLGERGVLLLLETAFSGSALDYLQFLGARDGMLPAEVQRCIESGLPTPRCFGVSEFDQLFPVREWTRLACGPADVHARGMRPGATVHVIPGFFAAVRRAPAPNASAGPSAGAASFRIT
jgi:hypothetical protein